MVSLRFVEQVCQLLIVGLFAALTGISIAHGEIGNTVINASLTGLYIGFYILCGIYHV